MANLEPAGVLLEQEFSSARILVVDDEPINLRVLQSILERSGYSNIVCTNDSRQALTLFQGEQPDIILLDLNMPHLSGYDVMNQIRELVSTETYLPILILTADVTCETKLKALSQGATDFITKPFDATEAILRIRNLLRTRYLNKNLEDRVRERTREIKETQIEVLQRLSQAAEYRDDDTGQHTQRVGRAAELLARALMLPSDLVKLIGRASPLHDVGKIGVPDSILLKPDKLSSDEFSIMKGHTVIGGAMLKGSRSDLLQVAEQIALSHHEKWNGAGYPAGLSGEAIPIEGRILAVVDVFDALMHERPYKKAWTLDAALAEIERSGGSHFDPVISDAFLQLDHNTLV